MPRQNWTSSKGKAITQTLPIHYADVVSAFGSPHLPLATSDGKPLKLLSSTAVL